MNYSSKNRQDALPKSRSGGVGTAGSSKTRRGPKTRRTRARGPGSAVGRVEVSKEHELPSVMSCEDPR